MSERVLGRCRTLEGMIDSAARRPSHAPASSPLHAVLALLIDVVLVVVFVALGQDQHTTADGLGGLLVTGLPFLIGLVAASALTAAHRTWHRVWPHGVVVWLATVAVGMVLRVVWGQGGAPLSFVLVSLGVLGVFLLGRRGLSAWVERRRATT